MSNGNVQIVINVVGNAEQSINAISQNAVTATAKVNNFSESMAKIRDAGLAFEAVNNMFGRLTSTLDQCTSANNIQQEAEAKLARVMRNTMGATDEEIQSIKDLASAQQQLGVIGDEVQLAGAQELGTYLSETESLQKLLPVMNDMLAQQYGLNASQEQAVTIGSMMGKVMEGQVGALSRYGYKFDEAQEQILKYGTEAERVETLAEVIGQSVGGMNEALAATPEGQIKQVDNNLGDIQERIGALWVKVKADLMPTVEKVMNLASNIIGYIEDHQTVFATLATVIGTVVLVVKSWVFVQGILNVLLTANPIGIIIILVAALIAAIVAVVSKTKGWGETWGNLMEYLKLTFKQAGAELHKKWLEVEDFFITGFETIAKGWYKVQSLWDSEGATEGLAKIEEQRNKRLEAIAEVQNKIDELNQARHDIDIWQVKWKESDEKGEDGLAGTIKGLAAGKGEHGLAGTMDGLMSAVNAGLGGGGSKELDSTLGKSVTATATGGTRNTTVNINLGKMVESINFNGGFGENAGDIERKFEELFLRVLYMAQNA